MSVHLTLGEAARQVTVTKSTLHRAIHDGRLSANRDDQGHYQIDPVELFRVFDPVNRNTSSDDSEQGREASRDDSERVGERLGTAWSTGDGDSVRWFQQQIEELQEETADLRKENEEKDSRLTELRLAMAALPSPESVQEEKERLQKEHEAQLKRQQETHASMLAREQNQHAKVIAKEKQAREQQAQEIDQKESEWQSALESRKREIQQAREASEALSREREEERRKGEALTKKLQELESRGLFARLLNRKPKTVAG
jgi:excisionase family DNA binding protein